MRALALTIAVAVLALAALWNAGELHRQNCVRAGHVACSVLPWDNGHLTPAQELKRKYDLNGGWGP